MSGKHPDPGVLQAQQARQDLYDTLGQLRERLDFAQRIDNRVERARRRIAQEKRDNPLGFAIGVAAAATVTGLAVWGVVRLIAKSFD